MTDTLVLACGNSLRGDDGVAHAAAARVQSWKMPDVRVICVHQLTPEVIDEMNNAARVIFLDASVLPADAAFDVSAVKPRQSRRQFGHFESAQSLLALLAELEGRVPEALLLSIRAASFEHGESLTETARKNLDEAMAWLRSYLVDQQCTKSA